MKTVFERIINRELPSKIEFEDDQCIVIHDLQPQAPVHLLIIPKRVIPRVGESVQGVDEPLLGHLLTVSGMLAKKLNLERGFRLVINNGQDACETVPHMHIHMLAGRQLGWPPG